MRLLALMVLLLLWPKDEVHLKEERNQKLAQWALLQEEQDINGGKVLEEGTWACL